MIEKQIDPKLGYENQVGLRLRCVQAQAETVHRALRLVFPGKVSRLMPSFHRGFNFCVYVTADETTLEQRWAEVLIKAGFAPAAKQASSQAPAAPTALAPIAAPTRSAAAHTHQTVQPALDLHTWENLFREAVKRVGADLPSGPTTSILTSAWQATGIEAVLPLEQEEERLLQSGLPPENILRAQIALYARSKRPEQIVAICRQRRQEVLALPPSSLLVEQILQAHQHEAKRILQATSDDNERQAAVTVDEAGRQIGLAFLPELERLGQASRLRLLLWNQQTAEPVVLPVGQMSLSEQLQELLQIAPDKRISELLDLRRRYPRVASVQIALGDTYAALGDAAQALLLYQSVSAEDQNLHDTALARRTELLIEQGRPDEVLRLLPNQTEMPVLLAGLYGAALLLSGDTRAAQPLLRTAWEAGERRPVVVLAWARALVQAGRLEEAAEPYHLLVELMPGTLSLEDCRIMTIIAMGGGFGDLSNEQVAQYYDRYLQSAGRTLRALPDAEETLWQRVALRRVGDRPEALLGAAADWLEWQAEHNDVERLARALNEVRRLERERAISREQRFTLLEGIEPLVVGDQAKVLAGEYLAIGLDELGERLRNTQPLPTYTVHLRQALHFLDRASGDMLAQHIEDERRALAQRSLALPERETEEEPAASLAGLRLTLVGGHSATRREVERTLREHYGLSDYTEVPPSSEEHMDRGRVLERAASSHLVAVITGYTGHDLTNHVRDLQQAGQIRGQVLWLSCRGKSGVVREIVAQARQLYAP
ncbi:MAG: hypothetical protein OHK0022_19270 [Roseiflexaceae bacterium]